MVQFRRPMIVDLTYLQQATDGNKELISQLVDLFKEQVVEFTTEMEESLKTLDSERLRRVAHKAKGSISALGMMDVRLVLQEIEDICVSSSELKETVELRKKVDMFEASCRQAEVELTEYLAR